MKFKEELDSIIEYFVINKKLFIAVIGAIMGLVALQGYVVNTGKECLGLADSKELVVTYEMPVVVKKVFVIPGQKVEEGDPLIEVEASELNLQAYALETEIQRLQSEQVIKENLLSSFADINKEDKDQTPLQKHIRGLKKQLLEIEKLRAQTIRYAQMDSVIGSVNVKVSEKVAAFTPVLTLSSVVPSAIYGFLHESMISEFKLGDRVVVSTLSGRPRLTQGIVAALGNRITAFPPRLQSSPANSYYGREIVISLPFENEILVGEKVKIQAATFDPFSDISAVAVAEGGGPRRATPVTKLFEALDIEASGVVNLDDKNVLIVSDENNSKNSSFWKFSLKSPGLVNMATTEKQKVDDIESIVKFEKGYLALSSLSRTKKKGKIKEARNSLNYFESQGEKLDLKSSVSVRAAFIKALSEPSLLPLLKDPVESLNIETLVLSPSGSGLFFLKSPQTKKGQTLVFEINALKSHLEKSELQAKDLKLKAILSFTSLSCSLGSHVSDGLWNQDGQILLAVQCQKSPFPSQVWSLNGKSLEGPKPRYLFKFKGLEGFTLNKDGFVLVSDLGGLGSSIYQMESQ